MGQEAAPDPDDHPQCRFPARRQWLAERLGGHSFPFQPCPKYERWTRSAAVESVSIVFATGYLGNPASYYGHTLLKFNFARDDGRTRLQEENRDDEGPGFVRASADVIVKPNPWLGVRLGYEHRVPVDAPQSPYGLGHAEIRLALGVRSDLRIRRDWDIVITLNHFKVPEKEKGEVMAMLGGMKPDVINH